MKRSCFNNGVQFGLQIHEIWFYILQVNISLSSLSLLFRIFLSVFINKIIKYKTRGPDGPEALT